MSPKYVEIFYQMIAFLFAISVHESAHAWTASRCGDPTARMLGRVSLNPIRHIDLFGTIILPLVAAFSGIPLLGWAKPTPVDPRNFRRPVFDDILTSVAGPVSNFMVATGALLRSRCHRAFFLGRSLDRRRRAGWLLRRPSELRHNADCHAVL